MRVISAYDHRKLIAKAKELKVRHQKLAERTYITVYSEGDHPISAVHTMPKYVTYFEFQETIRDD